VHTTSASGSLGTFYSVWHFIVPMDTKYSIFSPKSKSYVMLYRLS